MTLLTNAAILILALAIAFIGLAGVFLPFLPGVPIVWLGLAIYAYLTGFATLSLTTVLVFLGLTFLTIILDFLAPIIGAKSYKASKYGITGAFLGMILGLLILGPIGIIVGPFAGAFLGEFWLGRKESEEAFKASLGTVIGFLAGALIKTALILVMLGFFIAALF